MPRPNRVILPQTPVHLVQRGNNRGTFFAYGSEADLFWEFLG